MGWVSECDSDHEGYVVALLPVDTGHGYIRYRELRYPDDDVPPERVHLFQVACDCGWRSRRYYAPLTAVYAPYSLSLGDEQADEQARMIWQQHLGTDADSRKSAQQLIPHR